MFFIGIFGVQSRDEVIKAEHSVICPICGAYDRYEVIRAYDYFHVFFIPVWKWNKRYYVRTRCCQRVCELDEGVGSRIEQGQTVTITSSHVRCSEQVGPFCPDCGAQLDGSFRFCPYCGGKV